MSFSFVAGVGRPCCGEYRKYSRDDFLISVVRAAQLQA
jgi:hypothetical protein